MNNDHPNCRCVIVVTSRTWLDDLGASLDQEFGPDVALFYPLDARP